VSRAQQIVVPAEWAPQKAVWTAWPADAHEWAGNLDAPRADVAALVKALSATNAVKVLVNGEDAERTARAAIGAHAQLVPARYGDIWLRDTGPIFAKANGASVALRFKTNSWGGKFHLPDDDTVGDTIAELARTPARRFDFVLEGGAVDQDGEGTVLTTRQTTLNPNRNGWTKDEAEAAFAKCFGTKKVIWIEEGLIGDHTDGHNDNIDRFVAPGVVACQSPAGPDSHHSHRDRGSRRHPGRGGRRRPDADPQLRPARNLCPPSSSRVETLAQQNCSVHAPVRSR
jgi:agmatine deiminase